MLDDFKEFTEANNVLIIGMGGGFDVFAGLPFVGRYPGKKYVLANIFYDPVDYLYREAVNDYPHCKITDNNTDPDIVAKYSIGRNGCLLTKSAIEKIIQEHNIEYIIAVDGGFDSLMRGDEDDAGTVLEDFNTLAALNKIKTPKIMVNVGFGTETEESLNHYRVLENIAYLIKGGGMLGMFFLNKRRYEFDFYRYNCELAWKDNNRKSHIQTKIISAAIGGFGDNIYKDVDPKLAVDSGVCFVNPLNAIYWLFNLHIVAFNNKALPLLEKANTFADSKVIWKQYKDSLTETRDHKVLPL